MIRIISAAALTLLAVCAYRKACRPARHARGGEAPAPARPLQTWEGEGGGLPASSGAALARATPADESGASLGKDTTY